MATNPLTEQHYMQIQEGIAKADEAIAQADMAARAGINLDAVKKEAEEAKAKLLRMKQVYFPGR